MIKDLAGVVLKGVTIMKKKVTIWVIIGVLVLCATGAGIWFWMRRGGEAPKDEQQPKDPNVVAGQELADSGDVAAAIKKYEETILQKPESVDASVALAEAYAKQGDIDKARKEIDRIATLVPTDTRIYDTMVGIYKEQNRYVDAALFINSISDATVRASYEKKLRGEDFPMYTGFGNTSGNLTNEGLVAITDDAVYYSDKMDGKALYRASLDGNDKKKLSDLPARDINVWGDTVYFIDSDQYKIHAVKTDGSDERELINVFAQRLMIIGDRLYYSNWGDSCKIYSAKLDGTDNKLAIDVQVSEMSLSGAWLYYIDREQMDQALYCIRIDGQDKAQLSEGNSLFASGLADEVYFVNWADGGKLYRMRRDQSTAPEALSENKVGYVNLCGDWVYYIDWVKGEHIYRRNINDGTVEQVNNDPSEGVFVKGDYVYYYNSADGKRLYRVNTNGKNKTLIGK